MKISIGELRALIKEALSNEDQKEVLELMKQPEFDDVISFAESKIDNDETTYTFVEMNALAFKEYARATGITPRSLSTVPKEYIDRIKAQLAEFELTLQPRATSTNVRGFTAPKHGSNRYAGNAGGSGTNTGGWIGIGGGQGAMGGKYTYNSSDKRSLPFGSRRS